MCKYSESKFPGQKGVALGKGLLIALVRDLNEIALTLFKKDLDAVVDKSKKGTEEAGLEKVGHSHFIGFNKLIMFLISHLVEMFILANICVFCSFCN